MLELIVKYLEHHKGKVPAEIAKPIRSVKMEKIVEDEWDAKFINGQPKRMIFQIILGANYMDIKSLSPPGMCEDCHHDQGQVT